jgi:hypothetical protein
MSGPRAESALYVIAAVLDYLGADERLRNLANVFTAFGRAMRNSNTSPLELNDAWARCQETFIALGECSMSVCARLCSHWHTPQRTRRRSRYCQRHAPQTLLLPPMPMTQLLTMHSLHRRNRNSRCV